MRLTIEFTPPTLLRRRRRGMALAAILLALALPAGVLASHLFSDVPSTMSGHAAIEAIADAGITVGCAPDRYCPTAPVTREQMAIFLQRGLPRIAGAQDLTDGVLTGTATVQNSVDLAVGGNAGGTQFVKVDVAATGTVDDASGCPCTVHLSIDTSTGATSEGTAVTVSDAGSFSMAATFTFPAPSGSSVTIDAVADRDGAGTVSLFTDISAISAAFGGAGSDVAGGSSGAGSRFE